MANSGRQRTSLRPPLMPDRWADQNILSGVSRFLRIVTAMFCGEHVVSLCHAVFGECKALKEGESDQICGNRPTQALRPVVDSQVHGSIS